MYTHNVYEWFEALRAEAATEELLGGYCYYYKSCLMIMYKPTNTI